MSSSAAVADLSVTRQRPSQIKNQIRLMTTTTIALFIWGSPGLGKSEVGMAVATEKNVAFVDVRLSMYAPTDVAGMPYRVEENGETTGVAFTPPKILPRDIELSKVKKLDAVATVISFKSLNPKGSNSIYYVKKPEITATAMNRPGTEPEDMLTAEILSQNETSFIVQLVDSKGRIREGQVHYTVEGKAEAIVAFEELNSAPLATQQAAYQFILDRRIGEYEVPIGVRLIAMGNRQTDKGLTYNQPTPLANRFVHVEMIVSFLDWQIWATSEGYVHPLVVGYLSQNKGEIDQFNPTSASRGFATPRSWVYVSKILYALERPDAPEMTRSEILALVAGAVGDGSGVKFMEYRDLNDSLPKIEDIISGHATKVHYKSEKDRVAIGYALVTSCCYELQASNEALEAEGISGGSEDKRRIDWYKGFNNVLTFWMENFQQEINVMGMRTVLTIYRLPVKGRKHLPMLQVFTKEYSDFIR